MALTAKKTNTNEPKYIRIMGGKKLSGTVAPDGAKNSALIQLAASAIVKDTWITLENLPLITDVYDSQKMLEECGFKTKMDDQKLTVMGSISNPNFSDRYGSKIRASLVFLGSVLSRVGEIKLPLPGGDKIGDRPIDIHMDIMQAFGIKSEIKEGFIYAKAEIFPLKATTVYLRYPSVLATVNGILLGVLAEGKTILHNVAKEPEIVDCTNLLSKMGAKIHGVGTDKIIIEGVKTLHATTHEVMPDRLEAAALMMSIIGTGGVGTIENIIPEHNQPLFQILNEIGVELKIDGDKVHILSSDIRSGFRAETRPYPGLATDLQPIITALALRTPDETMITDTVFKERFAHVPELRKFGAEIFRQENTITIKHVNKLSPAKVLGNDIRAVVSLINAALCIDGESHIEGIEHLKRGHANFIKKLKSLNAEIEYM